MSTLTQKNKGGRPTVLTAWGQLNPCVGCQNKNVGYGPKLGSPTHCAKCKVTGQHIYLLSCCPCSPERKKLTWGAATDKKAIRCIHCKLDTDINFGSKKEVCKVCKTKKPKWGPPGTKSRQRYFDCRIQEPLPDGTPADTNNKNPKCMCLEGEGRERVRKGWGKKGTKKALRCKWCKHETDVQVSNKRCGCPTNNRPSHGPPNGKPTRCVDCQQPGDVNHYWSRIVCKNCPNDKARMKLWGPIDSVKPIRCGNCKLEDDVNLVDKKCKCGSGISPSFCLPGGPKNRTNCYKCKTHEHIDSSHALCKGLITDNIPCPGSYRGNSYYDGYCTECFIRNFPTEERALNVRKKTWELKVRDFLIKTFPNIPFIHDKPLFIGPECDCTHKRQIDFRHFIGNTLFAIECDEHQHKSKKYEDDKEARYDDLYMAYSGKMLFIRFNPHPFKLNGYRVNPDFEDRLEVLKSEIEFHIKRIEQDKNEDLVEIHYLFYDQDEDSEVEWESESEDSDSSDEE